MITTLRIALAYFSFVGLQRWLNWIFGVLMSVGLVLELRAKSSFGLSGAMIFASLSAMLVVVAPAFAGGLVMRVASTPNILHLRPHGRAHMLVGATLVITLATVLMVLPMMVAQLTGIGMSSKATEFHNPALGLFQVMWGGAALVWIIVFAMSRHQALAPLSFTVIVILVNVLARSVKRLPITVDQFAVVAFLVGIAAWIAFARWYMRTPSVRRPEWIAGWASGQPSGEPGRFSEWRGFGRNAAVNAGESRAAAMSQYFTGSESIRPLMLVGLLVTALFLVVHFYLHADAGRPVLMSGMYLLPILCSTVSPLIVRRARLIWLRAGLDRAALYATAERSAWRTLIAMTSAPVIFFALLTLTQWPEQTPNTLLFIALELTIGGCFLYSGLAVTRGWNAGVIAMLVGLLVPTSVVSSSLAPPQEVSVWAFAIALAAFGALALVLRGFARRAWLVVDWRLTGPPLPNSGMPGF